MPPPPLVEADGSVNARKLFFRQHRFDIIFKYIYLDKHLRYGKDTAFFSNLYIEHIRAFNDFYEDSSDYQTPKQSPDDFIYSFEALLSSIKESDFDPQKSRIPVDVNYELENGAHRLAACAYLDKNVFIESSGLARYRNYKIFMEKGLPLELADYAALEYVKLNPHAYIVNLHSVTDPKHDVKVEAILNKCGFVFYKKEVHMSLNGYINLKKISYGKDNWTRESWIGSNEDDFHGAKEHAQRSMGPNPMRIFVFVCDNLEKVVQAKKEIRDIYNIGNYSIHINDFRSEAVELAQTYFNKNSLFIINARPYSLQFSSLDKLIDDLKKMCQRQNVSLDEICASGSTPLSILGIRECADLDFLYCGKEPFTSNDKRISNHDSQLQYYPYSKTEIVQNPTNHFYYRGVKFITPTILLQMKQKRGEKPKDIRDCEIIEKFLQGMPLPVLERKASKFSLFRKIKRGNERTVVILGLKFNYRKKRTKRP